MGRRQNLQNYTVIMNSIYSVHSCTSGYKGYKGTRQLDGYTGYIESLGGVKRKGINAFEFLITKIEETTFAFYDYIVNASRANTHIKTAAKSTYKDACIVILFLRKYNNEDKYKFKYTTIAADIIVHVMRKNEFSNDEIISVLKILIRSKHRILNDIVEPIKSALKKKSLFSDEVFSLFNTTKSKLEEIKNDLNTYSLVELQVDNKGQDTPNELLEFIKRFWSNVDKYNLLSDKNIVKLLFYIDDDTNFKTTAYNMILSYCSTRETKLNGYVNSYSSFVKFQKVIEDSRLFAGNTILNYTFSKFIKDRESWYSYKLRRDQYNKLLQERKKEHESTI